MHLQPWSWSWHRKFSWARLALSPGTLPPGLWIKPNFIRVLHNRRISAIKTEILLRNEPQIVRLSHWISYQIILHARKEIVLEEGGGVRKEDGTFPMREGDKEKNTAHIGHRNTFRTRPIPDTRTVVYARTHRPYYTFSSGKGAKQSNSTMDRAIQRIYDPNGNGNKRNNNRTPATMWAEEASCARKKSATIEHWLVFDVVSVSFRFVCWPYFVCLYVRIVHVSI